MRSCSRSSTTGPPSAWCDSSRARRARPSARSSSKPASDRVARACWRRRSPRRKCGVQSGTGPSNTPEEAELRYSAEIFEAALAQNPVDLTVLEALREIYTRLGDIERLMHTAERIEGIDPNQGAAGGRGRSATPAPAAPPRTPAAPPIASPP